MKCVSLLRWLVGCCFFCCHCTETALLKVVNDIFTPVDVSQVSQLFLHNLCTAFYTINHFILLSRLHHTFGISCTALSWFQSYLCDRTRVISINGGSSAPAALNVSVFQGQCWVRFSLSLEPILFLKLYLLWCKKE